MNLNLEQVTDKGLLKERPTKPVTFESVRGLLFPANDRLPHCDM